MQKDELVRLGNRIRDLRLKAGLSLCALCYRHGLEVSTLSRIEKAEVEAKYLTLLKIAEALNMKLCDLLKFD